ncbi:P-loop containing nucleoside triphosphate hydrolase protein, partial [Ochromonadaceae sp. CCMP2298]
LSACFLDSLMKGLTVPITEALDVYKRQMRGLHPFESTVVELTVIARVKAGLPDLDDVLADLQTLRAATSRVGKEFAGRASNATTAVEAKEIMSEGMQALEDCYLTSQEAKALNQLSDIQKDLRRIPMIELDVPTVVLVGAPNVGKSSLVRAVSSGTPEVNDYPFTTRGVTVGHIVDQERGLRFQVMDTPGLLDRPAEERNEMERLTFASMANLPTAVMYVIDPSGLSGDKSTLRAQLAVRSHLKARFPQRPWMDVVSKADLGLSPEVEALLPEGYLSVSVESHHNVGLLKDQLEQMLLQLQDITSGRKIS